MHTKLNWINQQKSAARSVAIGTFDGVHLGHRGLLQAALELCPEGGTSCALTFDVPPDQYFRDNWALLNTFEQKTQAILDFGIDEVAWLSFNRTTASLTADEFVEKILVEELQAEQVICGFNHRFGKNRTGDVKFLQKKGFEHNFAVVVVPPITGKNGETISSTMIRGLIQASKLGAAAEYLGYYPTYLGQVVQGFGRGRKLGFPTANLQIDARLVIPGEGVYLTWCILPNSPGVPALTSIGRNPTFGGQSQTVECYLLDFDADLYGQELEIQFLTKLREIVRYNSSEELQSQIRQDIVAAEELLRGFHLQAGKVVLK